MNWTAISNTSLIGRILRLPLRLIPPQTVLPILQGPVRGRKWIVGSGNHGYWLGSYEMGKTALFAASVPAGGVVYDLGANVGYYTLISSFAVGAAGRVFAFEPLPRNADFLRRHLKLNRIEKATVIEAAVAERSGTIRFEPDSSTSRGRIGGQGTLEVRAVAVDEWMEQEDAPAPDLLKIDIEGAEALALRGAQRILTRRRPPIFLSTHSGNVHRECLELLASFGYRVRAIDGRPLERSRDLLAEADSG
jgi:FkbM family methyltransferase